MSWGDVWVSGDKERPEIGSQGPQAPWTRVGAIMRGERALLDATRKMEGSRDSHARSVDFLLHVYTSKVALTRAAAKGASLTFEPDGLWVAVELTPPDDPEHPRFAVFVQRVRAAGLNRPTPKISPDLDRRPLAILPLRALARSRGSAVEWGYKAPRL